MGCYCCANRPGDLDLLCVLAFAFDPSVLGSGDDIRNLTTPDYQGVYVCNIFET